MSNKPYLLALNRLPQVGPRTVMRLLERWPTLKDLFSLSKPALEAEGLSKTLVTGLHTLDMRLVEDDLAWAKLPNHHILSSEDEEYPRILKEIHDPPTILYAIGELAALKQPMLAIVGTRKPSVTGQETAFRFAKQLAAYPLTLVSGLAHGIDGAVHAGCLKAEGSTIAVMGTGIDTIYPKVHAELAQKIQQKGLLLTEFPLKSAASAGHFPRRNRIISGLSLATLVVEAAMRSGSLITARLALEQNRDVLAIPGSIHNKQAAGCHHLLQQGAKLVTTPKDILQELGMDHAPEIKESPVKQDENILKYMDFEVVTIDKIVQRSQLAIEKILAELAQLEIKGIVKAVPGGYSRCMRD